jgi:septal ring factor EnvC (AmiA/AmiB activator)
MNIHSSRLLFHVIIYFALTSLLCTSSSYADERSDQLMKQMKRQNALLKAEMDKQRVEMQNQLTIKDTEIETLQSSLTEQEEKNKKLQAQLAKEKREKAVLAEKLAKTESTLAATEQNLTQMIANYNQAQEDLSINDRQRKTQLTNLANANQALLASEAKNEKLYQYGLELIKVYAEPEAFDRMMREEIVTQLKRVELENILQEYNDKIDAERLSVKKRN